MSGAPSSWPTGRSISEDTETGDYQSLDYTNSAEGRGRAATEQQTSPQSTTSGGLPTTSSFVTQPPRPRQGLTGKISTLFRRESSRERPSGARSPGASARYPDGTVRPPSSPRASKSSGGSSIGRTSSRGSRASRGRMRGRAGSPQEADDNVSVAPSVSSTGSKRIFYSSNADDDSDDSYESRMSKRSQRSNNNNAKGDPVVSSATEDSTTRHSGSVTTADTKTIVRYRGFSTSIKSLFLDETVVCASMGCFGLILSNRTEYLLQLRNERRGALSPRNARGGDRKKGPSRIVAYGLVVTIVLMFATFVVWGFGTGNGLANAYYRGYYDADAAQDEMQDQVEDYYGDDNGNAAAADDAYDDYLNENERYWQNNQNQADDGVYQYNNQYNDDANNNNQYNDDANNNQYNDDANNNANDGYNQNQQYNQYNNNQYNDDGNNAAAADDGYNQNQNQQYNQYNQNQYNNNDDNNANDAYQQNQYNDNNNGGDDFYAYTDDGNRRVLEMDSSATGRTSHPVHGVFKLRDFQENLWDPIYDFVQDEWFRPESASVEMPDEQGDRRARQASTIDDEFVAETQKNRDLASNIRVALLFSFLFFLGVLGRRRRMRTRFYLVRARAQEDHLYYASTEVGSMRRVAFEDAREDQYEGACSHTLCGCYPVDEIADPIEEEDDVEVTDDGIFKRKRKSHNEDIIARGFNCLMGLCCGFGFKCWFQALSICALAQEAREIRLLVPPRYQRIDYITHQPFHEYQKDVNDLRRGWLGKTRKKAGFRPHFSALSRLSRYILITFSVCLVIIIATLVFNPRAAFSWQDAVVLVATFVQAFLVLFIVHWIFHKSDLSLDAVIKLFAAGFVIAVPSAFLFAGILVNCILFLAWIGFEIMSAIFGDGFVTWVLAHWRAVWIVGELVNAYIVAAVTEELCKYYTFRAIEHPDLVFLTGLNRVQLDDAAVDGGLVKYPFGSHQVQELNRNKSFGDASQYSHRSNKSSKSNRSKKNKEQLIERTGTREDEFDEDETDVRTHRQKAMAITTGMISVAVGLACAENFLYVFVLGGAVQSSRGVDGEEAYRSDVLEEWIVLFFRSIFPIHALAAALQSINMIRKFVETDDQAGHRIGVGRVVLPAVLLHGSFDAVLMGINVYQETAWDRYLEENNGNIEEDGPYNSLVVNLVAWISITGVMLSGILWYYRENRSQRLRLKILEEQVKAGHGGSGGPEWNSTAELV
jgi:hypothetical protein